MNRQSIFFTITISFIISLILVTSSFVVLLINDYKNENRELKKRYFPIAQMVLTSQMNNNKRFASSFSNKKHANFKENIEAMNLEIISKPGAQNAITYNPMTKVLVKKSIRHGIVRVISLNNSLYLYIKDRKRTFLLKDNNDVFENTRIYLILVFAVIFITLIISFITTLRKLYPLKILKDKVKMLGDEHFDFKCCDTDKLDEVSVLAKEFKNAADKLKQIKEARNIFIRNIMHELKTPITKGKFLSELDNSEKNDEKLKNVFNRLESLINEFSSIEELISSTSNIEKNDYFLADIIDNASDMLLLDDDVIINKYSNKKLNINFKLFSVAVKNLLDNAIKYSNSSKVRIESNDENEILFINDGKKLLHPLEDYFEPFFMNEDKSKEGFGLGLYIVNAILKANEYELKYIYENEENIFIIKAKS